MARLRSLRELRRGRLVLLRELRRGRLLLLRELRRGRLLPLLILVAGWMAALPAAAQDLTVTAPPSLSATAERIRRVDQRQLASDLADAGLEMPPVIRVTLIGDDDEAASQTPRWIVGLASGTEDIVIFPARVGSYPYDSLEAVLRHEIVHLALTARAGGRPLPRWFHEGVAVAVGTGWGLGNDLRLLFGSADDDGISVLTRLFESDTQLANAQAYRMAAVVVADVRRRHGSATPGAIAAHVARGVPFARAFEIEVEDTPDATAARVWSEYRRWNAWLPVVTGGSALWVGILLLAFVAFVARRRKRLLRRRQWDKNDFAGD
jgi:hypothetical protein